MDNSRWVWGLVLLFVTLASASEPKTDEGVYVLTNSNFKDFIADGDVLVEFYAPWCGHCKALAPEYISAATLLKEKNSNIKLAKVDATEETELAEQMGIRGYPTLKFYRSGVEQEYSGGRTAKQIVEWLEKKTGPPAQVLKQDDVKTFREQADVAVVGYFSDEAQAKDFLSVASTLDDVPFGVVYGESEAKVVVYKKFDDLEATLTDLSVDSITKFIKEESLPLLVDFNQDTAQKVFGGEIKSHLLLFLSKEAGQYDAASEKFKNLAKNYKGKLLFVTINTDDEDHGRILEFFGMKKEEVPSARIIQLSDEMIKYKPSVDVIGSTDAMKTFVEDFLAGNLKQHLLSQDVPADWDFKPLKIVVSSNYDEVTLDKSKSVLAYLYAPWCGHCKQVGPIIEELAAKVQDNANVLVVKMDATANELAHTKVNSFPTIKLYKRNTNEVVDYNGARTLDELQSFLESDGEQVAPPAEDEEEDDDAQKRDEL